MPQLTGFAMALAAVTLNDKYAVESGRIFLTGTQALVRLPMMQRARDVASGLNTACFISGYRGSPLGGFDQALWSAKRFLEKSHIRFQPGVNEDLGATAVWGSQQVGLFPDAKYDGVFAMWYGKGPGVDRSGDVFKHGNAAGTAPKGGVLLLAGDDHACKSSTLPHQSEYAFMDASIPVLNPSGVQDILDVALFRVLDRAEDDRRDGRQLGLGVGRPAPRRARPADGFRAAAGRAQHPLARSAARPGVPPPQVQALRRARLRPRQQARQDRPRQPEAAHRHRHHRQILSR